MSEKRFTLNLMKKPSEIEMDGKMISKYDVVRLLNKQQATINELEQENADLLADKIRSLDEFEKCTNKLKATINKLKEENKELEDEYDDFSNFLIDKGLEFEFEEWCKDE